MTFSLWLEIGASWDSFFVSCPPLLPPLPSSASLPVMWHPLSNGHNKNRPNHLLDKNRPNLPKVSSLGTGSPMIKGSCAGCIIISLFLLPSALYSHPLSLSEQQLIIGWWCHECGVINVEGFWALPIMSLGLGVPLTLFLSFSTTILAISQNGTSVEHSPSLVS